ncbi:ATP-binding protein, partial [Flavobacteriaceae bacterium]|nr:ATP-binding protein [Flavobacteriaceae bacterium]
MIQGKINKRIVLAGGPSTGKTSVINALSKGKFLCFQEAAREILTDYKLHGSEFKTNPIGISNEIFKRRHEDYEKGKDISCKENLIFYDRGIHEITAYLKSINKSS